MNYKRVLIVMLVLVAIFASLSVASAGFLEDLFGEEEVSEPFNTTIDGINFTIPAGYVENENLTISDSVAASDGQNRNQKIFYNEKEDEIIAITVASYSDGEIYYDGNDTEKTIAGIDGYFSHDNESDLDIFSFIKNNKGIIVIANNETTISEIIS